MLTLGTYLHRIHSAQRILEFDARVQAVSGIGVVEDAGGAGVTMPPLLRRTLQSINESDYKPDGWQPSLVVIYLGSNDYTLQPSPPSQMEFTLSYAAMVDEILRLYPAPPPPVLHICGGEATPCSYIKSYAANVTNSSAAYYSTTGDTGEMKAGCIGHRNLTQQARLARYISPILSKAAGWKRVSDPSGSVYKVK